MEWLVDSVFKMFTYKAIDLNITKEDINLIATEIKSVSSGWYFNEYRNCEILSIYDKNLNGQKKVKLVNI